MATGIMKMMASQLKSGRTNLGRAIHDASAIGLKSTTPKQIEQIYPTIIPAKIGMSLSRPLPNIETMIVVRSEISASPQLELAILTPVPANDNPMSMMTGPTTIGGNSADMNPTPRQRTRKLITP